MMVNEQSALPPILPRTSPGGMTGVDSILPHTSPAERIHAETPSLPLMSSSTVSCHNGVQRSQY